MWGLPASEPSLRCLPDSAAGAPTQQAPYRCTSSKNTWMSESRRDGLTVAR
jgi:hypothetical protein